MSQHADRRASNEELTELRRQLNEKVQLLEFGRQIGQIALASADLDEVLDRLARKVIETGLFDVLMIALVDVKADRVVPVRSWMRDETEGSDHTSVSALSELTSPPLLADLARAGELQIIENWDGPLHGVKLGPDPAEDGQVAYFVPVKQGDRVLALLGTTSKATEKAAVLLRIEAVQPVLSHIAVALEHARLYGEVQAHTTELEVVNWQLQSEILERQRSEELIQAALAEKEVLLKEVHHRVKNNLQVICSMLDLQTEYVRERQPHEILRDTKNRIGAMGLIHENLYGTPDLELINCEEYIRNLVMNLFVSHGAAPDSVVARYDIDVERLDVDTAVPCGLIVNELVTNSLKYAFPSGRGEIHVELLRQQEGRFGLLVGDDGEGFPPHLDPATSESLGLKLVTSLGKQLGGAITFETNGGALTRIDGMSSKAVS